MKKRPSSRVSWPRPASRLRAPPSYRDWSASRWTAKARHRERDCKAVILSDAERVPETSTRWVATARVAFQPKDFGPVALGSEERAGLPGADDGLAGERFWYMISLE
jgi:hypothetical protein